LSEKNELGKHLAELEHCKAQLEASKKEAANAASLRKRVALLLKTQAVKLRKEAASDTDKLRRETALEAKKQLTLLKAKTSEEARLVGQLKAYQATTEKAKKEAKIAKRQLLAAQQNHSKAMAKVQAEAQAALDKIKTIERNSNRFKRPRHTPVISSRLLSWHNSFAL